MTHLKLFKKQKAMFLRNTLTKNYNGTYWPLTDLQLPEELATRVKKVKDESRHHPLTDVL